MNTVTIGDWNSFHGPITEMVALVPRPDLPDDDPSGKASSSFLWIVVALVVMVAAGSLALLSAERHARETARETAETRVLEPEEERQGASQIRFGPEDIQVNHRWTVLAGKRPAVTFTSRVAPELKGIKAVFLAYRTLGAPQWGTAEAAPRRNHTYRITLHDLHRDMPYECFFFVCCKDTVLQSRVLEFHT